MVCYSDHMSNPDVECDCKCPNGCHDEDSDEEDTSDDVTDADREEARWEALWEDELWLCVAVALIDACYIILSIDNFFA